MKMNQKGVDNMQTPDFLFKDLNKKFNFTVDGAAIKSNKKCLKHFNDGLASSWSGHRVFCNPPFSQKEVWLKKAHDEVLEGNCPLCVMILPSNSTDTKGWHKYVFGKFHYEILEGRVSFIDPETGQPKKGNNSGTALVYFWRKPSTKPQQL